MKKRTIIKTIQILSCILSWLTLSPLFYYLAGKFKLMAKRWKVILLLISPLMVCTYFILYIIGCFGAYFINDIYLEKYHYTDNETIERITGASFPELDMQTYYRGARSFTGDYSDRVVMKLTEKPSEELRIQLDSLADYSKGWEKKNGHYHYFCTWGNGDDAPNGESDKEQRFLFIYYTFGEDSLTVDYGRW